MSGDDLIFLAGADAGALDAETLKSNSATALERALAFVEREGDDLSKLRAHCILAATPAEEVVARIAAAQAEDGSVPRLCASSIEAFAGPEPIAGAGEDAAGALCAFEILAEVQSLHSDPARALEARLRESQAADGSWGDPKAAPEDRIYATGMLAGFLGRTRFARPAPLDAAGEFLAGLWSPDRVEGGGLAALQAFAHFYTNVHHELADGALQWCGRELERGFRERRLDAAAVARVLLDCDASALPAFQVTPPELVERLIAEQAGDGGFAELAVSGASARVAPTLDAMRALIGLNQTF